MLFLPANLEIAIQEILKTVPASQWTTEAQALSRRYRGKRNSPAPVFAKGEKQVLAYLAQILPATLAQLSGAMTATQAQAPEWKPISLLDIGSGPGTALWAALEHWPSLQSLAAWEREPAFMVIGQQLARASTNSAVQNTQWQKLDLKRQFPPTTQTYDLIILGHVLNELNSVNQRRIVSWAWEHCTGVVLIVEPGNSAAFPAVTNARNLLLSLGAKTLAPCPHDLPCPLIDDWCHFPRRLQRPKFQRRAKAAISQWEDCKFAYAAMARFAPAEAPWARIICEPQVTKAFVEIRLCTAEGIKRHRDDKKDREAFKSTKHLVWGQHLSQPLDKADSLLPPD